MGLSCGMSLVKYILFVFNLLCALCGIALLTVGIIVLLKINEFEVLFEEQNVAAAPILMIVVGSIIFIIAFFGCCGAIRESHCMTMTYGFFLLVLIIAQIVGAIIVFVYAKDIATVTRDVFDKIFEATVHNTNKANMEFVELIQSELKCCGRATWTDWGSIAQVPPSCCSGATPCPSIDSIFKDGCSAAIGNFVNNASDILAWVAIGVAGVELIGLIFACCLANNIRNQRRRYA